MKKLSPVWFLKSPIDYEHKYYVISGFIKSIESDLKEGKIHSPLKSIVLAIKSLEHFKKNWTILIHENDDLDDEDFETIDLYNGIFDEFDLIELNKIIEYSLEILHKKSEHLLKIWGKIEKKIKIFSLDGADLKSKLGIAIFRSTLTDQIFPIWWKKTDINIGGIKKSGIIMKNVDLRNPNFSMSYEYILREILYSIEIKDGSKIPCAIIEINDDFNRESEIYQIAKEKIIGELNSFEI